LLLSAAARLQAIRDGWDGKSPELDAALLYNRKLWSIFVTSATSPENPLPAGLRQNVANLGIFVFKQTLAILADPKPENLGSLININRELAAGLLTRA
jgi:flagellar protein FlaF